LIVIAYGTYRSVQMILGEKAPGWSILLNLN